MAYYIGSRLTQIKNAGYNSETWLCRVCLLISEASTTTGLTASKQKTRALAAFDDWKKPSAVVYHAQMQQDCRTINIDKQGDPKVTASY